ncbi:uncharacterized protein E0L32_005851 [Thyridium curvatum]|uniref:Uncharacterized protein n=1 Tax=Thyridium curvatum TaxID=1093900 RepID=A0A507BA36_9PEZI|nr:uncharacterized protein E0L32_005851 [Thyridium curvatum]TPX13648.1 hypothetical protein E0L32_005851 [Thyridium curvatum]
MAESRRQPDGNRHGQDGSVDLSQSPSLSRARLDRGRPTATPEQPEYAENYTNTDTDTDADAPGKHGAVSRRAMQLPSPSVSPPTSPSPPPSRRAAPASASRPVTDEDIATNPDLVQDHRQILSAPRLENNDDSPAEVAVTEHTPTQAKSSSATQGRRHRNSSGAKSSSNHDIVRRLSANQMQELAAAPESLPVATIPSHPLSAGVVENGNRPSLVEQLQSAAAQAASLREQDTLRQEERTPFAARALPGRPAVGPRTVSTPPTNRRTSNAQPPVSLSSSRRNSSNPSHRPIPLNLESVTKIPATTPRPGSSARHDISDIRPVSPLPTAIPLPPMSIPTVLQLELAGHRPSPLYIHHSQGSDLPYESSAVKFERLKNFLLLPSFLERTMYFGVLACLDAWLWTFTILPIRFCVALGVLFRWWAYVIGKEVRWITGFVWEGLGRMWRRGRRGRSISTTSTADGAPQSAGEESRSQSRARHDSSASAANGNTGANGPIGESQSARKPESLRMNGAQHRPLHGTFRHRRTKSMPSNLTSFHKADLLQGAVILFSSIALMNLDASRMYHFIRAQSNIKLYVIYNLLEVSDRLLSALGQDVFECLFSSETLSRNSSGRSKIMLPFGMFLLALLYNVAHAVVLFYQVITLNVAVNSYSNALLTLLMSNQFVEVKSAVFKRFEKENTFQLTCADIVERFQLWIMLIIIGMRNIVEVGGLSVPGAGGDSGAEDLGVKVPLHNSSIIPASFTILPSWLLSGEVLSPFLIVIGSEMIVDWIKHAYINKFNNIKPNFYSRILDILCKDYYTNAFVTPSLTRRLGLPLFPLCCLFIRASVQTYHMFLATHLPSPIPPSSQTSLVVESSTATPSSPAMAASLERLDSLIRNALGRSVHGYPYAASGVGGAAGVNGTNASSAAGAAGAHSPTYFLFGRYTSDDLIALLTMVIVFFIAFLVLLVAKLLLGMALLRYSRNRYARMKAREHAVAAGKAEKESYDAKGSKRIGGYGAVEVGDERRRWLYDDDAEGLRKSRERERRATEGGGGRGGEKDLGSVKRYEMIAKRIW